MAPLGWPGRASRRQPAVRVPPGNQAYGSTPLSQFAMDQSGPSRKTEGAAPSEASPGVQGLQRKQHGAAPSAAPSEASSGIIQGQQRKQQGAPPSAAPSEASPGVQGPQRKQQGAAPSAVPPEIQGPQRKQHVRRARYERDRSREQELREHYDQLKAELDSKRGVSGGCGEKREVKLGERGVFKFQEGRESAAHQGARFSGPGVSSTTTSSRPSSVASVR